MDKINYYLVSFGNIMKVIAASLLIGCVLCSTIDESELVTFHPFKDATFINPYDGRIINGDRAADGQFPWQVYVIATNRTKKFTCGGSVISDEWILTAAHCVYQSSKFEIGYGTNTLHGATITRTANRVYVHPKYNPQNLNNDIALIKVKPSVHLSNNIKPVQLPKLSQVQEKYLDKVAIVSGWGRNEDLSSSVHLQYTNMKIIRNPVCAIRFRSIVIDSTVCAIGAASKKDNICYGDSGGPLVIYENRNFIQIGVVSFVSGFGCTRGYPSGYARITSFRKWISDVSGI